MGLIQKKTLREADVENKSSVLEDLEDTYTIIGENTDDKPVENKRVQRKRNKKSKTLRQFTTKKVLDDDGLYDNPETPTSKDDKVIAVIYDTGAAITQFPAEYKHAWKDLKPCMHRCLRHLEESRTLSS